MRMGFGGNPAPTSKPCFGKGEVVNEHYTTFGHDLFEQVFHMDCNRHQSDSQTKEWNMFTHLCRQTKSNAWMPSFS